MLRSPPLFCLISSVAASDSTTAPARKPIPMLKFWKRPDSTEDAAAAPASPQDREVADSTSIVASSPGWFGRLRSGLAKTSTSITGLFVGARVDEALFDELESALLAADAGVDATNELIVRLRARAKRDSITDASTLQQALSDLLTEMLLPLESPFDLSESRGRPFVIMMIGVNGAGKTTSIGKIAKFLQGYGATVALAAGDTFRAAAREQLVEWGRRNGVVVVAQQSGDPAAVMFDAIASASARGIDVVIADTAGRLPTQGHLMDELKKVKRVIGKAPSLANVSAPQEILLVIDGNTGQNAVSQVKAFDEAVGLTGLIVTKLDGTAKGGVLAAIALVRRHAPPIPVYFIGVGEQLEDLRPFVARDYVNALLAVTER